MTAPTGCSLTGYAATCDYRTWLPPLLDYDFDKPPSSLILNNVNGTIESNAFSGLANTDVPGGTYQLSITCSFLQAYTLTLLSDSLTSNLSWVAEMSISDCTDMTINDGAMSAMTGVTILTFLAGSFLKLSSTALTGMTSLETLYMYATMPTSGVPSGLFSGLTSLRTIDMSRTTLNSLPSGLFDGLTGVTTLTIEDTGLTALPANLFDPLTSLTSLNLDYNLWPCSCDLLWLKTYLDATSITTTTCVDTGPVDVDLQTAVGALNCTTTTTSSTTSNNDDDDDWKWYVFGAIGAATLALVVGLIACLFCPCCCRNRRKERELEKARDKNKARDQQTDNANARERTGISDTPDEVAKTGYVSIEKKKHMSMTRVMTPVESWYLEPELQTSRPALFAGRKNWASGGSSVPPRTFRASNVRKVAPSVVNTNMYRAQLTDKKTDLGNWHY